MQWISWYIWYIIFKTFNTYTELKQWMFYKYSTIYSRYCGILRHFCDRVKNECCRCNKCSTFTKQLLYMHMSSAIKWKCVFGAELPLQNKDIIESICIHSKFITCKHFQIRRKRRADRTKKNWRFKWSKKMPRKT